MRDGIKNRTWVGTTYTFSAKVIIRAKQQFMDDYNPTNMCVRAYWWALVGLGRGLLAEESILGELLLQSHGVDGSLWGARRHRLGLELLTAGRP